MKIESCLLTCGLAAVLAFPDVSATAASVTRRGPDVLSYMVYNTVTATELGPETAGDFQMQFKEKGPKISESFRLNVTGMEPDAIVSITAALGDDVANVHVVGTAPTDRRGRLRVRYLSRTPAPARGFGAREMPDLLTPIADVGAICVENTSGEIVGVSGVFDAAKFRYLVRRNLTSENGVAEGSISLTANQRRTGFSLLAGGLEPGSEYTLFLNSTAAGTVTADDAGRLRIRGWPAEAPPPLEMRTLSLTDSGGNPVLSTTFPR